VLARVLRRCRDHAARRLRRLLARRGKSYARSAVERAKSPAVDAYSIDGVFLFSSVAVSHHRWFLRDGHISKEPGPPIFFPKERVYFWEVEGKPREVVEHCPNAVSLREIRNPPSCSKKKRSNLRLEHH